MDKPVLATGVKTLRGRTTLTGQKTLSRQLRLRRRKVTHKHVTSLSHTKWLQPCASWQKGRVLKPLMAIT